MCLTLVDSADLFCPPAGIAGRLSRVTACRGSASAFRNQARRVWNWREGLDSAVSLSVFQVIYKT